MVCCFAATCAATNFVGGRFQAAEKVELHFEDMTIPIQIDELILWQKGLNDQSSEYLIEEKKNVELSFWLNILGFESRAALSEFLSTPLITEKSVERELLHSWAGRKLLDKISDLVIIDQDKTGVKVFNTLEKLLEDQTQASLLDLLKLLPAEVIHFDLDGLVEVISSWRNELEKQQKLLIGLRDLKSVSSEHISLGNNKYSSNFILNDISKEKFKINSSHRSEDFEVQLWRPLSKESTKKHWIIFMPGLGGDPNHFSWLAQSLTKYGWEVVLIDHPGSNTKAMFSLLEGENPFPSGVELFPYRLADLRSVLEAKELGQIKVQANKVILMGHSLGALNALLASGAKPQNGLLERCNKALDDFAITNLSRLIQCQLVDVPLIGEQDIPSLSGIVGLNSFGKLLWPDFIGNQLKVPIFLTGGTFDLITPALSEQLGLLLSANPNDFSRVLIIEGASHFSPIKVDEDESNKSDLYKISDSLVGVNPTSVQSLLAKKIISFLDSLENSVSIPVSLNNYNDGLNFHILDRSVISTLTKN